MGTGGKITNKGRVNAISRAYLSSTSYTAPYQFQVGIGTTTPTINDTNLSIPVPISAGTVNDDGSNALTGSSGGDNTTSNTSTYKEGANVTDNTAQNLISNDTSESKVWTISNLATNGTIITGTSYVSCWLYIKDSTTLALLKSSGTCVELKFGSDSSNYYSLTKEASDLVVGWNWISSYPTTVEDLTETGSVSGDIDTFIIEITTNNVTDTWNSGDVVYDLLRSYATSDLFKTFMTGYPTVDETNVRSNIRAYLTSIEATGFDLSEIGVYNNDSTPVLLPRDVFTSLSKSSTAEVAFIVKDQMGEHS